MKSLHDQIADGCVHHRSPVHNKTCSAGVNYRELVGGPDFGWMARRPCVRNSKLRREPVAECAKCRFPNENEIQARLDEIEQITKQFTEDKTQ